MVTRTSRKDEINAYIGERIRSLAYKAWFIYVNNRTTDKGTFMGNLKQRGYENRNRNYI